MIFPIAEPAERCQRHEIVQHGRRPRERTGNQTDNARRPQRKHRQGEKPGLKQIGKVVEDQVPQVTELDQLASRKSPVELT